MDNAKQLDVLIGISRSMEKSLQSIEKKSSGGSSVKGESKTDSVNVVANLAAMANSIKLITDAVSERNFKAKNAKTVLDFIGGIATVSSKVNPENLKALGESATGISKFVETFANISIMGIVKLVVLGKVLFGGKESLVKKIIGGAMNAVDKFTVEQLEKLKLAGTGIHYLALSLSVLGKAMGILALIAVITPLVLIGAGTAFLVVKLFTLMGTKLEEMKEGFSAISILGKGLIMLSIGLASMALLSSVVDMKTFMNIIVVVSAFTLVFSLLGKLSTSISKGANSIKNMGISMLAFSAGLAGLSLVMMLVPPKALLMGAITISVYALAFYLIGKLSQEISKGALTVIVGLSVGLFFFSGALLLMQYTFSKFSFGSAIKAIGVLIAFSAAFAGIGFFEKQIVKGASSVAMIGAGLGIFSIGMLMFALSLKAVLKLFEGSYAEAAIGTVAILGGLAGIFALAGLMSSSIVTGSLAIGSIGAGLGIFSIGMLMFALSLKAVLKLFEGSYAEAAKASASIIGGLSVLFIAAGIALPLIVAGSASIGLIGISLAAFSIGLTLYALTSKMIMKMGLYDEKTKEFKGTNILESVARGIAGLAIYIIPIAIGTPVALALGLSLMGISTGLIAAAYAVSKIPDAKLFSDKLFSQSTGVIPTLARGFASIYKEFGGGFLGALKTLTGTDPVSMGIRIIHGMGDALQGVAGGIAAFANFENFPIKIPDANGGLIYSSVNLLDMIPRIKDKLIGDGTVSGGGILLSLANIFAKIGNLFPGGFLTDSSVKKGTDAVSGIGNALRSITGGIIAFANFEKFPTQTVDASGKLIYTSVNLFDMIPKIKDSLIGDGTVSGKGILFSLANVFGQIGKAYPTGFFSDSSVQDGVNAVKGIGGIISEIAGGIISFANLQNFPLGFDEKTGKPNRYGPLDLKLVTTNIQKVLKSLPNVFSGLDLKSFEKAQEIAKSATPLAQYFTKFTENIVKIYRGYNEVGKIKTNGDPILSLSTSIKTMASTLNGNSISDNSLSRFDRLSNIFKALANSSDGFSKFTEAFIRLQDPLSKFANTLSILGNNFQKMSKEISMYRKFVTLTNSMADRGSNYAIFAPAFGSIAKGMKDFANNFKIMDPDTIKAFDKWTSALTEFSKIDKKSFSSQVENAKEFFKLPYRQGESMKSTDTESNRKTVIENTVKPVKPETVATKTPVAPKVDMSQVIMSMENVKNAINALNDTLTKNGIKIAMA